MLPTTESRLLDARAIRALSERAPAPQACAAAASDRDLATHRALDELQTHVVEHHLGKLRAP